MKKDIYKIEKLDHFGRGMITIEGKKVFVENALLGDQVTISIVKEKKNYSIGKVDEIRILSPFRKECFCRNYKCCGGCDIGELIYSEQLKFKFEKVSDILSRYLDSNIKINPIVYNNDLNYRNKITLHADGKKVGLYKKNSNEIIEIEECFLVNDKINELIKRVSKFVKMSNSSFKEIIIKNTNLDESMLVFKGNIDKKEVLASFNDIKSIFINDTCIKNRFIKEKLGDYEFLLSKDSFFQVNKYNTINLYNKVFEYVKEKRPKKVLDLYCGTGTIGIFVSKCADSIVGIEEVSDAIESANKNKKINNIENIDFLCGKVEDYIDDFKDIDLIITDPPRGGMSKKTIDAILKIKPKDIIYVSCDVMTLTRDLKILKECYDISQITPVDMFPNTYHVENVCVLNIKKGNF